MKKLIAAIALAAALAFTGCGSTSTAPAATESKAAQETPKKAADLAGAWKQSNSNSDKAYQQATITGNTMTIDWVTDGGNTTSIYWIGTFKAPTDATEPYSWTSQKDVEATKSALLASGDATKEFTYKDGTISYKASMMGTTTTVNLKKN